MSFHRNTVKENIALTHLQRHTPLTKGVLISCFSTSYCGDPGRHGSLHLLKQTYTHADRHLNTDTHSTHIQNRSPVIDSWSYKNICVYMSPQDQNTSSTLSRIVLRLFIHLRYSQTARLAVIFILVEPFVPQNKELILLITKREIVILLISCLQSYQFNNGDKEKESERGLRDLEGGKSLQSIIWLVSLQLFHFLQFYACFLLHFLFFFSNIFRIYYSYVSLQLSLLSNACLLCWGACCLMGNLFALLSQRCSNLPTGILYLK